MSEPSETTLSETPPKVARFLRGVAANEIIGAKMALEGYSQEDHDAGWGLLHAVSGFGTQVVPADKAVAKAIADLDQADGPLIRRVGAALRHDFPHAADFILEGLHPADGVMAVTNVDLVLKRIAKLESGEGRDDTRDLDQAAVAKLAKRKLGPTERDELGKLVQTAQVFDTQRAQEVAKAGLARGERVRPALLALWRWYDEWRQLAKEAITNRRHLISLGLAERRTPDDEPETPTQPALAPQPVITGPRAEA